MADDMREAIAEASANRQVDGQPRSWARSNGCRLVEATRSLQDFLDRYRIGRKRHCGV